MALYGVWIDISYKKKKDEKNKKKEKKTQI